MLEPCTLDRDRCMGHLATVLSHDLLKEFREFTNKVWEGRHDKIVNSKDQI